MRSNAWCNDCVDSDGVDGVDGVVVVVVVVVSEACWLELDNDVLVLISWLTENDVVVGPRSVIVMIMYRTYNMVVAIFVSTTFDRGDRSF